MDGSRDDIRNICPVEREVSNPPSATSGSRGESAVASSKIEGDEDPLVWMVPLVAHNIWYQDAERKVREALGLPKVDSLICLGLGSPSRSKDARYKVACALKLSKAFALEGKKAMIADQRCARITSLQSISVGGPHSCGMSISTVMRATGHCLSSCRTAD